MQLSDLVSTYYNITFIQDIIDYIGAGIFVLFIGFIIYKKIRSRNDY